MELLPPHNYKPTTGRQKLFVKEFLVDRNASKACVRAGYSEKGSNVQGSRLLADVNIKYEIDLNVLQQEERLDISRDHVIRELAKIAFMDVTKLYKGNGVLKRLSELDEDIRAAFAGVETDELFEWQGEERVKIGETKRVKTWDKMKALEILAKYFKLFSDAPMQPIQINNFNMTKEEMEQAKQLFNEQF